MDAKSLFTETGEKVSVSYCGKCKKIWYSEAGAEQCCQPSYCKCGNELKGYRHDCRSCQDKASLLKEKQRVMKAQRVTQPSNNDDYVYCDGFGNEGYLHWGDIEDECDSEDKEIPVFVYDCKESKWKGLSAGDIDDLIRNHFEDSDWFDGAIDQVQAIDELEAFVNEWNKKQTLIGFWPDYEKIIVLNEQRFNDWLKEEPSVM
ncbi:hypothetical protein H0A36_27960 [Endozoicomonas sp. SM1973]|uniref:Uncharacterized protein n=1 Tax=Spartinivicinus marinus TaxID=2994442 RepID=A0A853IDB1_9GAMM|nr:hypothetical protein [Spartinivicinus marinus]MCX4026981.1 hypothetical protein [Spartinivicinus marinus]NYZ69852.1 hypothetical protein [Spartinivicinus marinus]